MNSVSNVVGYRARKALNLPIWETPSAQFLLCQLFFCLISNEKKMMQAKHNITALDNFSPVQMF
jgi:hypothetical protein